MYRVSTDDISGMLNRSARSINLNVKILTELDGQVSEGHRLVNGSDAIVEKLDLERFPIFTQYGTARMEDDTHAKLLLCMLSTSSEIRSVDHVLERLTSMVGTYAEIGAKLRERHRILQNDKSAAVDWTNSNSETQADAELRYTIRRKIVDQVDVVQFEAISKLLICENKAELIHLIEDDQYLEGKIATLSHLLTFAEI